MNRRTIFTSAFILILSCILVYGFITFTGRDDTANKLVERVRLATDDEIDVTGLTQMEPVIEKQDLSEGQEQYHSDEIEPSITQVDLDEMYDEYIERANDGNLNAALVLSNILEECRNSDPTLGSIDELRRAGVSDSIVEATLERYERCAGITERSPDIEADLHDYWSLLRDDRHPLFMVKRQLSDASDKKDLLMAALFYPAPEPHLMSTTYSEAALYYSMYPENADPFKYEAWNLLACDASLHCDSAWLRRELSTKKFLEHDYIEITKMEQEIRRAIQEGDPNILEYWNVHD